MKKMIAPRKAKVEGRPSPAKSGTEATVVGLAQALAALVRESGALELRLDSGEHSLRMRRRRNAAPPPLASQDLTALAPTDVDYTTPIGSQYVGIFRPLHPKTGKPLVSVGDTVETNQCMGWVEAIGILHDVLAPRTGTVLELLAEPAEPVEFGQDLFLIQ